MKNYLRPCRRITDQFILASLLSLVIMVIGSLIMIILSNFGVTESIFSFVSGEKDVRSFLYDYFIFIAFWIVTLVFIIIPKRNRPILKSLSHNKGGNNLWGIIVGLFFGFATNALCIFLSCLKGDIHLSYNGFEALPFFAFLICVAIQSSAEEIVDRCYLYQKLRRRYRNPLIAIVINSLVFMAMHLPNDGIGPLPLTQIFIIGVVFSMFVYYYNGLWIAMAFHTAWNFTQSIVFGLPNSGIVSAYSVFKLEAASASDGPFYNVAFGVEGSPGAVILLALFGVILFLINRKKHEYTDVWAKAESEALEALGTLEADGDVRAAAADTTSGGNFIADTAENTGDYITSESSRGASGKRAADNSKATDKYLPKH